MSATPLLVVGVGIGALLLMASKASADQSNAGAAAPPEGSEPPNGGMPLKRLVKAASGRVYTVFTWPENASGYYSVAQLAGSIAWISFHRKGNTSTPAKTNCNDPALLALLRTDWSLS